MSYGTTNAPMVVLHIPGTLRSLFLSFFLRPPTPASSKALPASMAHFLWLSSPTGPLPNYYQTNFKFNINVTSEAEGTAALTMLRFRDCFFLYPQSGRVFLYA